MALPTSEQDWVTYLSRIHDQELKTLKSLNDEYEMRAPRAYMHPEIAREIGDRLQQVVIAWPQLVVGALEERLDIEGFRLPDDESGDDDLWRVWQDNDLDEASSLAHIDVLSMKRCYIAIGTNEDDETTPLVTYESPLELYADIDPRTRKVRAALRRYQGYQGVLAAQQENYATLYLPDATVYYEQKGSAGGQYDEIDRDEHNLGEVPIVPMINRARLADWQGRSELSPILPLAHAANKLATDMMVAAEFVAIPLRGVFGLGPEDLEDQNGNKITAMQAILGRLLTIPDDDGTAKMFEFASAHLSNFHNSINQLAELVASLAALPPHYLGMSTDNPASADAIRSNEIRLIKKAERKQRLFEGAHEQAMRFVRRFQSGDWDPALRRLETIWRDPSTPTVAQTADAVTKTYQAGIVPLPFARRRLGFSDAEIAQMEQMDQAEAAALNVPTADELMQLRNPQLRETIRVGGGKTGTAGSAAGSGGSPANAAKAMAGVESSVSAAV